MTARTLRVGVLALQGAFREHVAMLRTVGMKSSVETVEVRRKEHLTGVDGLVLPGGESTAMGKLLAEWELLKPIRQRCAAGMPIYGTCAGLILLCTDIEGHEQTRLELLDATVRRNAFGRQVDSFECELPLPMLDEGDKPFPAIFIRAPLIVRTGEGVEVLARVVQKPGQRSENGEVVAVRQGHILATSFHPELTGDCRLHRYFTDMMRQHTA